MFRWMLMVKKLFPPLMYRSSVSSRKARWPQKTEKPYLEELTPRILPSASSLPAVFEASPPAAPSVVVIRSLVDSMVEQRLQLAATIVQYASNVWNTLGQELIQEVAALQRQLDSILGIYPTTQNLSFNTGVTQPDSGTAKAPASGSGSGSGATSAHEITYPREGTEVQPLTSGSGSGSDSPNSGLPGTVEGEVWLDNNGDGGIDNNELGYVGATVNLLYYSNGSWDLYASTTTTSDNPTLNYSMQIPVPYPNSEFEIQVVFPWSFEATIPGVSQINDQGYTPPFYLSPGGTVQKTGGLRSMNVNTLSDDPNGPTQPNTVTLRDAIETGNNGPPNPAVTFYSAPNSPLSGTINLQTELPAIAESYDIDGPGAAMLTVNGNANADTIYTLDAGDTSKISGQTIMGGMSNNGAGGVMNLGNMTLDNDIVKNNQTTNGNGGGVNNATGGKLVVEDTSITGNSANGGMGGGIANSGKLYTYAGTQISGTNSAQWGGGIANLGAGAVAQLQEGTIITGNKASAQGGVGGYGGGIYNSAGKLTMADSTSLQLGAISKNSAISGGGLYVVSGTVTISDGIAIYNNQATNGAGGGVYIAGGTVKISGGSMYGNTTSAFGGGIYTKGGTLTLTDESIGPKNQANNGKGGAMYLAIGSTTNFVNNVTVGGGDTAKTANGIYIQNLGPGPGNAIVQANGVVIQVPQQLKPPVLTDNDDPGGAPVAGA